ncbi:MAG: glycoside hydrolase family 65 protein [Anaerolineales bacterium]|nr:glycoside hydrolase family 65 protein [Anaerolineales bacterium]
MEWKISETGRPAPGDIERRGNKLLISNGYIGYRGTLEEFNRDQKTATIVSGLYDRVAHLWREPVNLPNGGFVQIGYAGELLHVLTSKVIDHSQSLDLQHAVHERQTTFETSDGTRITIRSRRFASLARRNLLCMEFSVSADRACEIDICTGIEGNVWDINGPHLTALAAREQKGILSVSAVTHENAIQIAVSEAVVLPSGRNRVYGQGAQLSAASAFREFRVALVKDGFTFHKIVAHAFGLDCEDPLATSRQLCRQAAGVDFETLLAEHAALWRQRWENCDIQIEGDPAAQQALRFSMYHLLAIVPAHTARASIPARGMSGQMYKGAIFWDTEIFMLPFFTHAFPRLARNLLLYRYHTLDGARRKAREYGYRGAFYAWESQDSGDDACTLFNVTDVFTHRPIRTYFRDKQVHISADIAYAFWQYFTLTGDASIWIEGGAEVIFECARFYLAYIYYNPDRRRYEILDVTGPDEYHERVHNNAFTNRMVAHTFEVCLKVAALLRQHSRGFYDGLMEALCFESDLAAIAQIAPRVFQPDSAVPGTVIPQFDGYFTLENVSLPTLLGRKLHPTEYFGGGSGLATTTQIIKQADVVLMLSLFSERYPTETKSANWEYYESRTEHGSSLSTCSYALIAAQLGKVDWAYQYFMKTATIDLAGEAKQYVGELYIGGTHPAGNGGAWMSAVFGLCGIHCVDLCIAINPHLPAHWSKVTLPIICQGQMLRITLTHEAVTVLPVVPLEAQLSVSVEGSVHPLDPTAETTFPYHAWQGAENGLENACRAEIASTGFDRVHGEPCES